MVGMTDLLSRPSETHEEPGRPSGALGRLSGRLRSTFARHGDDELRPLTVSAAMAGLGAALTTMAACMLVAVVGWFAADAGAHGQTTDALRVGADAWLVGHGSRLSLDGVPLGLLPITLTGLIALVVFRSGRRAGRTSEPTDERTLLTAAGILTGLYLVVAVVTCVVVGEDAAAPGLGRAIVGALLVAGVFGTLGLAAGTGHLADAVDRVPGWVRAVVHGAVTSTLLMVGAAALLVAGSLLFHLNDAATLLSGLRLSTGDYVMYAVATLAVVPNAVLLGAAYLLGPGFALGTGTVVSPGVVSLGPVPAFPLLAAVPEAGPTPPWAMGVLAVPVVVAVVGAVLAQRSYRVTAYDSAALRGFGAGLGAALLTTLLIALAGGPMGTGRMADIGASASEVLVAAVAAMSLGGLVAGVVTAWFQRRADRRTPAGDAAPAS